MKRGFLLWAGENLLVSFLGPWSQRSKGKHVAYALRGGKSLVCLRGREAASYM